MAKKHYIKVTDIDTGYPVKGALVDWWSNTNYSGIVSNKGYQGSRNWIDSSTIPLTGLNIGAINKSWDDFYFYSYSNHTIDIDREIDPPFSLSTGVFGILDNTIRVSTSAQSPAYSYVALSAAEKWNIIDALTSNKVYRLSYFIKPNYDADAGQKRHRIDMTFDSNSIFGYKYNYNKIKSTFYSTYVFSTYMQDLQDLDQEWFLVTSYFYSEKYRSISSGTTPLLSGIYKLSTKEKMPDSSSNAPADIVLTGSLKSYEAKIYFELNVSENANADGLYHDTHFWNPVFEEINEHSLTDYELMDPNSYTGHPGHVWAQTNESGIAELDYYIGDTGTLRVTKNRNSKTSSNYELPQTQPGIPITGDIGIEPINELPLPEGGGGSGGGGGGSEDGSWYLGTYWNPTVNWVFDNYGVTAQVNNWEDIMSDEASNQILFSYALYHNSYSIPTYGEMLDWTTLMGNNGPYPDEISLSTLSGDVDDHNNAYYELIIRVGEMQDILNEKSFTINDPFIYSIAHGDISFSNEQNDSLDVCESSSIVFNINSQNFIENNNIERSFHNKDVYLEINHTDFSFPISAISLELEDQFETFNTSLPEFGHNPNLFKFENISFNTQNQDMTTCSATLSFSNEMYNYLESVFGAGYSSVNFSNIRFSASMTNITNERIDIITTNPYTFTLSAINYGGQDLIIDDDGSGEKDITVWPDDAKVLWSLRKHEDWNGTLTQKTASVSNKLFYDPNDTEMAKFGWFRNDNLQSPLMIYEIPWVDTDLDNDSAYFTIYNPNAYMPDNPSAGEMFKIDVGSGVVVSGGLSENLPIYDNNGNDTGYTIGSQAIIIPTYATPPANPVVGQIWIEEQ